MLFKKYIDSLLQNFYLKMKLDFRGLENLIKCSYLNCKFKVLQDSVFILKPCHEFYCLDHFSCKLGECEFCLFNKFSKNSIKSKKNFCNLEKTLDAKLGMCATCDREHKSVSEFQIEYLGCELIGFIEKIRLDQERFQINEPTKKSSYVSLHKKSSQTKTNNDNLDLFVKTVAETTVNKIKKQVKNYLRNKQIYKELIEQIRKEFSDLNLEIGIKYYQIKLEYLLKIKDYLSSIERRLINDIPDHIKQSLQDIEEVNQRIEKKIFKKDNKGINGLKKLLMIQSIKLNMLLGDIRSVTDLSDELISLSEIKRKFGCFTYPIPKCIKEAKYFAEIECPCINSSQNISLNLNYLDFETYWCNEKLITEIYFKNFDKKIK